MSVPFTSAFVKPNAVFRDEGAMKWLGSPHKLEEKFAVEFRMGDIINENYIQEFEAILNQLLMIIIEKYQGHRTDEFEIKTQIFYLKMEIVPERFCVNLKEVYMRPCAEGMGFYKMIMLQIVRACLFLKCHLIVQHPLEGSKYVLELIREAKLQSVRSPYISNYDGSDYKTMFYTSKDPMFVVISYENLSKLNPYEVAKRLKLDEGSIMLDGQEITSLIKLNPRNPKFISPRIMNYGPN